MPVEFLYIFYGIYIQMQLPLCKNGVLAVSLLRPGLLPGCQTARGASPYGPFGNIKRAVRQDRTARIAPLP